MLQRIKRPRHLPSFEDNKPRRADPCTAKHNSNMQQLTLQFEGYADTQQHVDVGTTKRCSLKLSDILPGLALRQLNPSAALQKVISNVKLFAQATLCACFGFGMMFLAAIIGG